MSEQSSAEIIGRMQGKKLCDTSNYVERMKQEHKELALKTKDLNTFIHSNKIFKTLCDLEQSRMIKQCGFMESYAETLESRIWVAVKS